MWRKISPLLQFVLRGSALHFCFFFLSASIAIFFSHVFRNTRARVTTTKNSRKQIPQNICACQHCANVADDWRLENAEVGSLLVYFSFRVVLTIQSCFFYVGFTLNCFLTTCGRFLFFRYYCDYCDTYLTHDSVRQHAFLYLNLIQASICLAPVFVSLFGNMLLIHRLDGLFNRVNKVIMKAQFFKGWKKTL